MELYELQNVATGGFGEYWKQIFQTLPPVDLELYKRGIRGFYILREVYNDPFVFGAISSRKAGTLLSDWSIRGDLADRVNEWISRLDVTRIAEAVLDVPFFGFQVFEINWDENYTPIEVIQRFPGDFRLVDGNLIFVGRGQDEVFPKEKFIYIAYGQNLYEIYGTALLSKVYYYWQFLRATTKLWVKYIEKFGLPYTRILANVTEEEQAKLAQKIMEAVQNAVVVHDASVDVSFIEPSQKDGGVFVSLIEHCKSAINQVILGHERGAMATPGKLGNETLVMNIREDLIKADRRLVEHFFDTLIGYWFKFQNLEGEQPYFYFIEEEDLQIERAKRDQILASIGVPFSAEYWKTKYNLGDEDVMFESIIPRKVQIADEYIDGIAQRDEAGFKKRGRILMEILKSKKDLKEVSFSELFKNLYDEDFITKFEDLLIEAYKRGYNAEQI